MTAKQSYVYFSNEFERVDTWTTVELWAEILHHFGRIFVGQSYGRPIISNE